MSDFVFRAFGRRASISRPEKQLQTRMYRYPDVRAIFMAKENRKSSQPRLRFGLTLFRSVTLFMAVGYK